MTEPEFTDFWDWLMACPVQFTFDKNDENLTGVRVRFYFKNQPEQTDTHEL